MTGIVPATPDDINYVARNLRPEDRAEIRAMAGGPPELMLPMCVKNDRETYVMVGPNGERGGLFGLQDCYGVPEVGWAWMVCCPIVEQYPFLFLQGCKALLPTVLHKHHPIITNHVDERNTTHIKWLRWLGFSFLRRIDRWGAENRPFIEFARLNPQCASELSEASSPPA